jgi:hypothetical protein
MEKNTEQLLVKTIKDEIKLLDRMVKETLQGGWSTNNVKEMKQRSQELKSLLWDMGYGNN